LEINRKGEPLSKKGVLDEFDLRLLDLLAADARSTIRSLSKKLNAPPTTVYFRLRKLERLRVVTRYTIVVDPEVLGFFRVITLIGIALNKANSVIDELTRLDNVVEVYHVMGDCDILASLMARDLKTVSLLQEKIAKIEGVRESKSLVIIKECKKQPLPKMI
jgi:Lrp/AsnC family leucine-responsive transcriptional regulator